MEPTLSGRMMMPRPPGALYQRAQSVSEAVLGMAKKDVYWPRDFIGASSSGKASLRVLERMPSAPITMSNDCSAPLAKPTLTLSLSSSMEVMESSKMYSTLSLLASKKIFDNSPRNISMSEVKLCPCTSSTGNSAKALPFLSTNASPFSFVVRDRISSSRPILLTTSKAAPRMSIPWPVLRGSGARSTIVTFIPARANQKPATGPAMPPPETRTVYLGIVFLSSFYDSGDEYESTFEAQKPASVFDL